MITKPQRFFPKTLFGRISRAWRGLTRIPRVEKSIFFSPTLPSEELDWHFSRHGEELAHFGSFLRGIWTFWQDETGSGKVKFKKIHRWVVPPHFSSQWGFLTPYVNYGKLADSLVYLNQGFVFFILIHFFCFRVLEPTASFYWKLSRLGMPTARTWCHPSRSSRKMSLSFWRIFDSR